MDSDKSVQETKKEQDRSILGGVTRFVVMNIAPSAGKSCSSGLNGSDLEEIVHNMVGRLLLETTDT